VKRKEKETSTIVIAKKRDSDLWAKLRKELIKEDTRFDTFIESEKKNLPSGRFQEVSSWKSCRDNHPSYSSRLRNNPQGSEGEDSFALN